MAQTRGAALVEQRSRLAALQTRSRESLENQRRLEARLLAVEQETAREREMMEENVQAEGQRIDRFGDTLEAVREALRSEAKAREAAEEILQTEHQRIDRFGDTLEAVREALRDEARAREALGERAIANHQRLDLLSTAIETMSRRRPPKGTRVRY